MAQKGVQLDPQTVSCSICLDLLKDPVTISCGHNYCWNCIKKHWDEEDQKGTHSCPQCRKTFLRRPVLGRNTMLAAVVEQLKKTGLQAALADSCYAGPEDVACDFCPGRKRKAVKSCLDCLTSYCDEHLQPHYNVTRLKKHKLVEPSKNLQENICSRHDEVMKIFCRTDQTCICVICLMDDHKGHDTVSAAAERTERQRELEERRREIHQRIQDREKEAKLLQQEVEAVNQSADKTVKDSEKIFIQLIRLIQSRCSDVKQQIRSQQQTEASRVKKLQEKLQQEIRELKRKDAELKQLSDTEDHKQFLHKYSSLSSSINTRPIRESAHSSTINVRPNRESAHSSSINICLLKYFEDVAAAVSELRDKLQDVLRDKWTNIPPRVTQVDVLLSEPKSRADFLKYSCEITFDPNTAHTRLKLSKKNKRVTCVFEHQSYPCHPDRFTDHFQVLSKESLTGRCYWEVEWGGFTVSVAVAYKNISRTGLGKECLFGRNDNSWALNRSILSSTFYHNNIQSSISGAIPPRVGVYVDHRAGILSFYSVSDTMTLIHRVQTTFTQPLYAGVGVCVSAEVIRVK